MMIVKNIIEIAWIPTGKARVGRPSAATKLKGHYQVRVKMDGKRKQKNDVTTTTASIEWVEKHFKKVVLGVTQRVAYEVKEELEFVDKKVPTSKKYGYVKVETEGVTCSEVDLRVINRLKYIPAKAFNSGPMYELNKKGERVPREERETNLHAPKWLGYCNATKEYVNLGLEWVRLNFDEPFLNQVRCCTKSAHAFILIPPGDRRKHQDVGPMDGPRIHYRQEDGEKTCMVYSMASAMHYFNHAIIGSWIYNNRRRFIHQNLAFTNFTTQLKEAHKVLNQVRVYKDQLPSFLGPEITGLYLARVRGSDGKEDHSVVLSQKWIFDSNFPNALPRNQQSMDLCCSTDDTSSTFVSYPQIAHFTKIKANT